MALQLTTKYNLLVGTFIYKTFPFYFIVYAHYCMAKKTKTFLVPIFNGLIIFNEPSVEKIEFSCIYIRERSKNKLCFLRIASHTFTTPKLLPHLTLIYIYMSRV